MSATVIETTKESNKSLDSSYQDVRIITLEITHCEACPRITLVFDGEDVLRPWCNSRNTFLVNPNELDPECKLTKKVLPVEAIKKGV